MKRALLFGVLWLVATAVTGAVAWGAVRLAGEQTAEQAVQPMSALQVEALSASSTTGADPPSTTLPAATTSAVSSTTRPATTGPTAAVSATFPAPSVAARQTRGGTVVVSLQAGQLSLVSAVPAPGYSVEVEDSGPEQVVVAFEGAGDDEVEVQAVVSEGQVVFEVAAGG
ncbi:MAG TPA: hypothetical protein VMX37_05045 [Acidimicrobiia bacterium]|nr:hypothetical protein [Acidimicrobiia bacterium]